MFNVKKIIVMKKVLSIIVLCAVCLIGFNSCQSKHEVKIIKVGAVLPMTGSLSGLGTSIKGGLELAINELNADSVKYELIVEDVASEQRNVITAYNKLKVSGVDIFVTAGSAYSLALKPNAIRDNKLLFCIASHPGITKDENWEMFKIGNSSVEESEAIVKYLKQYTGKLALLYPNTEYGIPFEETICRNQRDIILKKYDESKDDYKNDIQSVIKEKPERIILIGFSSSMGKVLKSIRAYDFKGEIICNLGLTNSDVMKAAGDAIVDTYYIDYDINKNAETTKRNQFLLEKYHTNFSSTSYLAYAIPFCIDASYANLRTDIKKLQKT